MPERYRRAEDALADLIRENRRGTRDSQRATGTEKAQTAATVLEMGSAVTDALEQAQQAIEDAADALTTSSGKNSRRRGQTEPPPPPGGWVQGDQWVVDNADGVPVEVRVWDGAGFVPEQLLAAELLVLSGGLIRLADGVVTADAIAADAIDGMTITGALIRTAPTGQRMQFDVNGLSAFNSSGTLTAALYAATGGLSLNGSLYLITPGDPQDRVTLLTKSGISAGSGEQIAGSHEVSAGISPGLVTAQTRTPAVAPNIQPGSYACYLEANEHGATLRLDAQPPSETVSVAATSITAEVTDAKAQLVLKSVGDDGPPMFETAEASVLRLRQTDRFIVEGGRTESPVFATGVTGRRAEADADAIKWYTATGMKRSEIKDSASGLAITSDQVTLTTSGGVTVDGLLSLGSVLRGNASQMTWLSANGRAYDGLKFWRTDELCFYIYIGGLWIKESTPETDTGWVPLTNFGTGWSSVAQDGYPALSARRRNGVVELRGVVQKATWAAFETIVTLPTNLRPIHNTDGVCRYGYAAAVAASQVFSNGQVRITVAGSALVVLAGTWMLG